eukprot:c12394_g1_i1.p1 GENE.c12394_g1_i1~~c12394_g1_i1.p1  ORF type:complete len:497 (+),score=99.52 c12394_g1_i1:44-1492(+)
MFAGCFARRVWCGVVGTSGAVFFGYNAKQSQLESRGFSVHDQTELRRAQSFDVTQVQYPPIPACLAPKHVVVLLRHGDRTPIASHGGPNLECLKDAPFWASILPSIEEQYRYDQLSPVVYLGAEIPFVDSGIQPRAQLTITGQNECLQIGSAMRRRYVEEYQMLPMHLEIPLITTFSTNTRRTVHSAQRFLVGLYPEEFRTRENFSSPIFIREPGQETLIPNYDGRCDRLVHVMAEQQRESKLTETYPGYDELVQVMHNVLGFSLHDIRWAEAREVLTCYGLYGLNMPHQITPSLVNKVIGFNNRLWESWYRSPESCKLSVGRLLNDISNRFQNSTELNSPPQLTLYTAHDNSLFPLLSALGYSLPSWPAYGAQVILELCQSKNSAQSGHFVRVLYNAKPIDLRAFCAGETPVLREKEEECSGKLQREWVSWEEFEVGLARVRLTEEQYRQILQAGQGASEEDARVAAEIRSTVSGDANQKE